MNGRSLKLIRDVIINSGKLTSIEISQDSIYLEFMDVELGTPKETEDFSLTARFAVDSFFTVFYNNIWDIEFFSKYDFKNQLLSEDVLFDVEDNLSILNILMISSMIIKRKNQFLLLMILAFTTYATIFSCWSRQKRLLLLLVEINLISLLNMKN